MDHGTEGKCDGCFCLPPGPFSDAADHLVTSSALRDVLQ